MRGWLRLPALRLGAYSNVSVPVRPGDARSPGSSTSNSVRAGRIQRGPRRLVDRRRCGARPAATGGSARPRGAARARRRAQEPTRTRQGRGRNRSPSCNATASTDASPATRSISSRTAVERSGMSPPATNAQLGRRPPPARVTARRAAPPRRARRGRTASAAPIGIDGSGCSGAIDHDDLARTPRRAAARRDAAAGRLDRSRRACRSRSASSALPRARSPSRPRCVWLRPVSASSRPDRRPCATGRTRTRTAP